jgi:hypothetical protein
LGCRGNGDISLFGYSTAPPFDPNIRSIYIPAFKNPVFHTTPHRGVELELTEAIIRELNSRRTPMKIVSDVAVADTELIGEVTYIGKGIQNRNLFNFNREFDVIIGCKVLWRDNRTGKNLTGKRGPLFPEAPETVFDPNREPPPPPGPDLQPNFYYVTGYGRVIPELGESNATGQQAACKQIARQIVNMMEAPW